MHQITHTGTIQNGETAQSKSTRT